MNAIDEIRWFLWDCWTWVKVRIRPDRRPSAEILNEVRERLSEMPAGKEIHAVFEHLDEYERAGNKTIDQ